MSVSISFLALVGVVAGLHVGPKAVAWLWFRKPRPTVGGLVRECSISVGITIAMTLAICLVLTWTGFTASQFYRPSTKDYGEHRRLGILPESVFFESADGTRLHGWFVHPEGESIGTVIHFHGSDRNITFTVGNAYWLTEHGFNLFAFDYRGYGKSVGRPSRRGVVEDATAAVEYVRSRPDVDADSLCLWGQSLGGQLAIVAAERAGRKGIRVVVAEATYASYSHHVKDKMAQLGPLWLVQWGGWLTTSDAFCALDAVGRLAPTPLLLVHGAEDRGVLPYHSEWLFDAAGQPKDIWRVEGAGHLRVFQHEAYREQLVTYLRRALPAGHSAGG